MHQLCKRWLPLLTFASLLFVSCGDARTSPEEEKQIRSMDSTSSAIEDSTKRLKEQTEKVEASLEKLNDSFKETNQTK